MSEAIDDTRQRSGNHILKKKREYSFCTTGATVTFQKKKIENKLSGKLSKSSAFLLFKYSMCLSTKVKKKNKT